MTIKVSEKEYYLNYAEKSHDQVISCNEMKFKTLAELKAMKNHLEKMSINEQSFQAYVKYIVTDFLDV